TVTDEDQVPLPGVTVEVKSPALIGGTRTFITSESGLYRFANLPPGTYELTFTLQGFQTTTNTGVVVRVDTIVTEDVVLKVTTLEESITVLAETPVVDVTKSGISTNWQTEMMDSLPLLRTCFFDLVNSTPGVWSHGGNTDSSRSVAYGTSSDSNVYLFDGVDTTSPDYGAAWAWLNPDVIQEIQVIGVGGKAEYGNFMGATINIVTKSGGNEITGGLGAYLQSNGLTGNNSTAHIQDLLDNGYISEDSQFPYNRKQFFDLSFQLGGPIIKDKIWFFASGWWQRDASSTIGVDPQYFTQFDDKQLFGKLTYQLTKNFKLVGFYNYEWYDLPDPYTPDYGSLDTVATERGGLPTASVSLTGVLSNTTFFELKWSYSGGYDFYESINYYKGPTYYDDNTGVTSGGPWWIYYFWPSRNGVNATLSHFAEDFLVGDHDFKFGVQYSKGKSKSKGGYNAGIIYSNYTYYYYGEPYLYQYKYEFAPYTYGAESNHVGVFLDDTWSVSDRLTLNVGIRYDYAKGWIPDMNELVVDPVTYEWIETDTIVSGRPDLVKWNVFSPRFGFAFKLTSDGKTLLRANAGRYYDHMIYGNFETPSPTTPPWNLYWWNGADWELIFVDEPARMSVDPNLKNPYSDQFSIGIDREILTDLGISFTYMEKWTKDMIGFAPTTGDWDDYYELITVSDPITGDPLQAYNLVDEPPELQITNPDRYYARFRMFSLTANKRMSHNWQMSASFTYSKMWGLNPRGINRQTFSENILWNSAQAKDPNHFLNIDGRMAGDRPYSVKILGTYLFPWGISASANFQIQAGPPYARTANIYNLNQGSRTVSVEARGDNGHRLPTAYLLDMNIEKSFRFADRVSLLVRFEVFNLLNRATPTDMMTYSLVPGQDFVYGYIWPPRRAQIGVKLRF
ncbi:MAG: TonB-dependent receptor, partial [Candidatus Aminicenantes bacterium]|nr:TonB-dependent receptor [Candidatus Aminicenantes bacterium]